MSYSVQAGTGPSPRSPTRPLSRASPGAVLARPGGRASWGPAASDFVEELQTETGRDVDGVHGQRGRVEGEQDGEHVLVVQQQLLGIAPLLELCLRGGGGGQNL